MGLVQGPGKGRRHAQMEEGCGIHLGLVLDVLLGEIPCSGLFEDEGWGRESTAIYGCGTVDGVRAYALLSTTRQRSEMICSQQNCQDTRGCCAQLVSSHDTGKTRCHPYVVWAHYWREMA